MSIPQVMLNNFVPKEIMWPRAEVLLLALVVVLVLILITYVTHFSPWAKGDFWDRDAVADKHLRAGNVINSAVLSETHNAARDVANGHRRADRHVVDTARRRSEAYRRAREHYMHAATTIGTNPRNAVTRPPRRAAHVLNTALNFAVFGLADFVAADPIAAIMALPHPIYTHPHPILTYDDILVETVKKSHAQTIADRTKAAQDASNGARGARMDIYTQLATEHTSDEENSHDSAVNACVKNIIERLRDEQAKQPGALPTIDAIRDDVAARGNELSAIKGVPRPAMVADAILVINKTLEGGRSIKFDISDMEALQLVWARAEHPLNAAVQNKIKQAIFDELVTCWEPSSITGKRVIKCTHGRIGRMITALALLDYDQRNWGVSTLETHRNAILDLTRTAVLDFCRDASQSPDAERARIGRSYLAMTKEEADAAGEFADEYQDAFRDELVAVADRALQGYIVAQNQATPGIIPEHMVSSIRSDVIAAIA